MNLIDTSFKRSSFSLEIKHSILFECALGIAVITYPKLHDKLSQPSSYWHFLRNSLSETLERELEICQRHNTWKMLLQLLHVKDFPTLSDFLSFIKEIDDMHFIYFVLPYLDESQQENRKQAAKGDKQALNEMILACKDHLFFPQMITYINGIQPSELKEHLIQLMKGWYEEVVQKDIKNRIAILERDFEEKKNIEYKLTPEKLVEWATGVDYHPESNISKVLLIPHYIYRPWTIQANIEGTKVFYYPVSEESIAVQKDVDPQLVQLYKALGDEKRLRIIKLLYEQDLSLKDLTQKLGIGKTTVHHHLAILRQAHIVRVNESTYSLILGSLKMHENQLWTFLESSR